MGKAIGQVKKRYTPLNFLYSTKINGSLIQEYSADYQEFIPDRRLVPGEALIEVRARDKKGNVTVGLINKFLTDVRWYIGSISEANNILDTNADFVIDRNSNTGSRGKIIVKRNAPVGNGLHLVFSAKYSDPRNGDVHSITSSVTYSSIPSTAEPLRVDVAYPLGQIVDPVEEFDYLQVNNTLLLGDSVPGDAFYVWQKKVGSIFNEIPEDQDGITGTFSDELKVPCGIVGERMELRCIADRLPDLTTGVNLISKKMISDDWNAIEDGTSTSGQDADGKYYMINMQKLQGIIEGGPSSGTTAIDPFLGKINFKTNQQYRISIKWKMQSSYTAIGMYILAVYSDGTQAGLALQGNTTSLTIQNYVTSAGATVEKLYFTYDSSADGRRPLIYDIQLVEYHGANNLVKEGSYKRVPASGIASGNEGAVFPISQNIASTLPPGGKATVTFGSVKVLNGNPSGITVALYSGSNYSSGFNMNIADLKQTITMISNPNASPAQLVVYAGEFGSVAGNAIEVRNVMLTIGTTAYEYSPADGEFLPAIRDGAPRPSAPSSRAIVTDHVLTTQYPAWDVKIFGGGMVEENTTLVPVSAVMATNRGDVVHPERYFSFPWKDNNGVIFDRGKNIFIPEERFADETFRYSVEPVPGLSGARWAADFNGIDQVLSYTGVVANTTPVKNKTYEVIFRYNRTSDADQHVFLHVRNDSTYSHRLILTVQPDGKIKMLVIKNNDITDYMQQWYRSDRSFIPGKIYKLVIRFDTDGVLTSLKMNGTEETFTMTQLPGGIAGGSYLYINYILNPAAMTVLDFKYIHRDTELLLHYDFQPLNGDRGNMLKGKNADGNALASPAYALTPINIPGIDSIDPVNGFFIPV